MVGGLACGNRLGPTGDEGDAVAAFFGVAFSVLPDAVGEVTHFAGVNFGGLVFLENVASGASEIEDGAIGSPEVLWAAAVVAGENDEGVFAEFEVVQGLQDGADVGIKLLHIIAKKSALAAASEVFRRGDVGVGTAGCEIEEEGLVFIALDKLDRFLGEGGVDLIFDAGFGKSVRKLLASLTIS